MHCWQKMEKINWTDCVRKEEGLLRVKKERNIFQTIKRRNAKWIGQILCRNCLIRHFIEGQIEGRMEVARRRGKRSKQLLGVLKETRGYWKLKRGSSLLHFEENSLCKTDYRNNECNPCKVFLSWRFMHQVVSEHQYLYTRLHGVTLRTT